jgi:hypothetical protein
MHVTDPHLWVNRSEIFFRCEHQKSSREAITVTSDSTPDHADENGSSDKFDLSVDNSTNAAADVED